MPSRADLEQNFYKEKVDIIRNKKTSRIWEALIFTGVTGRSRTCGLLLRRQPLYPSELQPQKSFL